MSAGEGRVAIRNRDRDVEVGHRIRVAESWWSRLRGLLGRPEPRAGEGLLIVPSRGVHMYGMRYPLDVLILGDDGRVLARYAGLGPGDRTSVHGNGRYALELPVGTIEETGTREGDVLEWEAAP